MLELPPFVDSYFISVVVFCAFLAALIYWDRKNIQFHYILMIRRTQRGKKSIDRIAQASPRFWKILSTIFVVAAFGVMGYGVYTMSVGAKLIVEGSLTVPSLQFVVPLPSAQPSSGPGYLLVPFWFWIVLVPFFMFPHEIAHGIVARAHKIRLKSVGILLLAIIPGAFVEPDDKQVGKSNIMAKLRLFSAGSIANLIFVILFSLIASQVIWPSMVGKGLTIVGVNDTSPAAAAGLKVGMRLESIGGNAVDVTYNDYILSYSLLLLTSSNVTINNTKALSVAIDLYTILGRYKVGQAVDVVADGNHYQLALGRSPENYTTPYMGVLVRMDEKREAGFEYSNLLPLIWWITTVGQGVAVFNLMPIYPLDGGLIVQSIAERAFGKTRKAKILTNAVSAVAIGLIAFNFIGPFIMKLF
jgi:membrane-associated protease RseP (regulator of RpoE activity)